MAKISTFLYCLGTNNQQKPNGPITAIGILPVLTPEFIPSAFSFSIVIGITGLSDDQDHILDICFKDNFKVPVVDAKNIRIPVDVMKNGDLELPDEAKSLMLSMELKNAILREEGMYSTEVHFDGERLGEYEIYVKAKNKS
jgi:hypothetical protein